MKACSTRSFLAMAILIALGMLSPHVGAQDALPDGETDWSALGTVEVLANGIGPRAPLPIDMALERMDERTGATGLIDGESYRCGRVSTLSDTLGYAAGVFVQPRFGSDEARIAVRGSGLQRTFHGRGLKVLQDGVPVNLADGSFDMQSIEPLSARYVEVWRGANALEYGAATLGGAINFVTPTGYDAAGWRLRTEAGGFAYGRWQAQWGGHSDRHDGVVSLSGSAQDGFRENARQENVRLFGNYGYRINRELEARVYISSIDSRSALPGALTMAQFRVDPRQANAGNVRLDQRRDYEADRLSAKLVYAPNGRSEWLLSGYVSDKHLDHPIFQVLQQDSRDRGIDLRWRFDGELAGRRNILTAGIGANRGDIRDDRFVNTGRANPNDHRGARTGQFDLRADNVEAFIENQHWIADRWMLALGVQALDADRRLVDRFDAGGVDRSFDAAYTGWNPKVGLRFAAADTVTVFANLSRSTEPPSFGELSGGPGVTQVDEQRADSAEVGVRIADTGWSLDAALYRADIEDELLALNDVNGNPLGTTNVDRTRHQGIEFASHVSVSDQISVRTNYLFNDFTFDNDATYGNNELAGIPRHWLRAELVWSPTPRLHVAPSFEWVPQDYFIDHANTLEAPGYTTWNMRVSGEIDEQWSWFIDGRNLSNRAYISTTGVVADAGGRDGAYFLPGDGRSFYGGIEFHF